MRRSFPLLNLGINDHAIIQTIQQPKPPPRTPIARCAARDFYAASRKCADGRRADTNCHWGRVFVRCGRRYPTDDVPSMKEGQPDLSKFFVEMFGLVMPEKVAEAVVARDVKMIFDPATKELIKVIMPFESKTEVMTLTVDKGWVTEATVEDVKLLPGVQRTMFRLQGGEWVTREIVKDVQSGEPSSSSIAATSSGGAIKA